MSATIYYKDNTERATLAAKLGIGWLGLGLSLAIIQTFFNHFYFQFSGCIFGLQRQLLVPIVFNMLEVQLWKAGNQLISKWTANLKQINSTQTCKNRRCGFTIINQFNLNCVKINLNCFVFVVTFMFKGRCQKYPNLRPRAAKP